MKVGTISLNFAFSYSKEPQIMRRDFVVIVAIFFFVIGPKA